MTRYGETEADDFFREDARRLGYHRDDKHEPGNGRGLFAYYRDHGMNPPGDKTIQERELTGLEDRPLRRADRRSTHGRPVDESGWRE